VAAMDGGTAVRLGLAVKLTVVWAEEVMAETKVWSECLRRQP